MTSLRHARYVERPLTLEGRKLELRVLVLIEHGGVIGITTAATGSGDNDSNNNDGDDDDDDGGGGDGGDSGDSDGSNSGKVQIKLRKSPKVHVYNVPTVIKASNSTYSAPPATMVSRAAMMSEEEMKGHFTNVERHGAGETTTYCTSVHHESAR